LLAALGFIGLHALRTRVRPSGRCERCGREVCKRCDSDARPSEALCAQCVNVFVRRTGIDPTERIRKEIAVQAYQRRRTIVARAFNLLSGAGHVLLGYPVSGVVFLLLTGLLASSVVFVDGTVVFATQKARNKADLLGSLLLRAELISEDKLQEALTEQQRSLKRLGDVLVHQNYVDAEKLSQVMRLQTTETLYKLFRWKNGTYEFTQEDVDAGKSGFEPIRAESILLEGFRRM